MRPPELRPGGDEGRVLMFPEPIFVAGTSSRSWSAPSTVDGAGAPRDVSSLRRRPAPLKRE